jgi:hypothetical protein
MKEIKPIDNGGNGCETEQPASCVPLDTLVSLPDYMRTIIETASESDGVLYVSWPRRQGL